MDTFLLTLVSSIFLLPLTHIHHHTYTGKMIRLEHTKTTFHVSISPWHPFKPLAFLSTHWLSLPICHALPCIAHVLPLSSMFSLLLWSSSCVCIMSSLFQVSIFDFFRFSRRNVPTRPSYFLTLHICLLPCVCWGWTLFNLAQAMYKPPSLHMCSLSIIL